MKKHQIISILLLSIFIFSCKEKSKKTQLSEKVENLEPKVDIKELESDFTKWWAYYSNNISLSSNFKCLNERSEEIDKKEFLNELASGNFIPLRLKSKDSIHSYKLYKLDSLSTKDIGNTIKNESLTNLKHFKMESTEFPKFDFTDLNGNHYTNKNTKGKIIVFKTWFISCKACVAEFPELNELVEKYRNRNDIVFISLAFDSEDKLNKFLSKKPLNYQNVSVKKKYIEDVLGVTNYPTHFIINKKGIIEKVVNTASEMILAFDETILDNKQIMEMPPPPAH